MVYTYNPILQKAEADGSLRSRSVWSTQKVLDKSEL